MSTQARPLPQDGEPFLIGDWLVEPRLNRLTRGEDTVQLELRAMDVLLCLVEHAGEVVGKTTLFDTVWRTEFVSDNTVANRIVELRSALGDDAHNPRYIETIRKRGYRLIAEVRPVTMAGEPAPSFPEMPPGPGEDLNPYPGLAAFTESDAGLFFGREAEAAALWRKIASRRLLAVIGPSGVGKTSLLRAGIAARAPPGWRVVVLTPGEAPTLSLARALAPDHSGDPRAVARLVGVSDPDAALAVVSRWRGQYQDAVLVVDQFEELFTLNRPEVQRSFIELLRRLVDAADVHVILAMRDDFLYQCEPYPEIAPVFDGLTPLGPPRADSLRRAITEPAARQLHRFESERLVDRMVGEVEDHRGALPLLAFAVRQLWERRDRAERVLTEAAYEDIGGVAGALARHAESVIGEVGLERLPTVREIFRNLVTAEGTRAVREVDELLSVFPEPDRLAASEVLGKLIDARLLTSFETLDDEELSSRRVEIIHESLLASWPRLVRWQTQDQEGAQLRDELRQAARSWDEHGRHDDRLWTGTAYREFRLWQERYPGGLSEVEEAFAEAMVSLAGRRRRRRRVAVTAVIAALMAGLTVVGFFWQRSVRETRRAEAAKLVTLGRLELTKTGEPDSSLSLAYALASLELADTEEGRLLALEALWRRPPRLHIPQPDGAGVGFSPDGRHLAVGFDRNVIGLWRSQGGPPTALRTDVKPDNWTIWLRFGADSNTLFASTASLSSASLHSAALMWSVADGSLLRSFECGGRFTFGRLAENGRRLVTWTASGDGPRVTLRAWPVPEGDPLELGELPWEGWPDIDPTGTLIAHPTATELEVLALESPPDRGLVSSARHDHPITRVAFDQQGSRVAAADESDEIRVWSVAERQARLLQTLQGCPPADSGHGPLVFDRSGSLLAAVCGGSVWLWDLERPQEAAPLNLDFDGSAHGAAFSPDGRWIAVTAFSAVALFPLDRRYPSVMEGDEPSTIEVAFAPDSSWLASAARDGRLRLWPVSSTSGISPRVLLSKERKEGALYSLAVSPDGQSIVAGTFGGEIWVVPVNGGSPHLLGRMGDFVAAIAISPDGQTVATGGGYNNPTERVIRLWDLDSGGQRVLDYGGDGDVSDLEFTADGRLWSASGTGGGVRRWSLEDGSSEKLMEGSVRRIALDEDNSTVVAVLGNTAGGGPVRTLSLGNGEETDHPAFGEIVRAVALDPTGSIVVTGDRAGVIRAGALTGGEPHLLMAPRLGDRWGVAVSPDGRWIAAGGGGGAIHIWPMPEITKPPLHTLPREELIAKLKTLTNLRVVREDESDSGWTAELAPFPGWETVPTW